MIRECKSLYSTYLIPAREDICKQLNYISVPCISLHLGGNILKAQLFLSKLSMYHFALISWKCIATKQWPAWCPRQSYCQSEDLERLLQILPGFIHCVIGPRSSLGSYLISYRFRTSKFILPRTNDVEARPPIPSFLGHTILLQSWRRENHSCISHGRLVQRSSGVNHPQLH